MRTSEVISILHQRGITLKVVGSSLRISGAEKLTDCEKVTLRAHKNAILRVLGRTPTPTTGQAVQSPVLASPAATGPLPNRTEPPEPAARECRNCACFEPYPFEPILGSCYALKRVQNAGSKPVRFGCSHFKPKESRS